MATESQNNANASSEAEVVETEPVPESSSSHQDTQQAVEGEIHQQQPEDEVPEANESAAPTSSLDPCDSSTMPLSQADGEEGESQDFQAVSISL